MAELLLTVLLSVCSGQGGCHVTEYYPKYIDERSKQCVTVRLLRVYSRYTGSGVTLHLIPYNTELQFKIWNKAQKKCN